MCDFENPPQYIALAQLHDALTTDNSIREKNRLMDELVNQGLDVNYALPPEAGVAQHSPELVGSTALHFAVKAQDVEVITYILQRGAKVTGTDNRAFSPLRLAIGCLERGLRRKGILRHPVVESMLKAQLDQNDTSNPSCKLGITHLHIACMVNDTRMVEFLLRSGAPVEATINATSHHMAGFRLVHVAARYCAVETLQLLLSHGADAGAREARGFTPLQLLIKYNHQLAILPGGQQSEHNLAYERAMKLLLDHCAAGPLQDEHGFERLHAAASIRDSDVLVDMLKENPEIDVNAAISENSPYWPGYTPLHFAARCGINAVKILVERGANLTKTDASHIAPFDICLERYEPKILSEIMSLDETLKSLTFTSSPLATVYEAVEALQSIDDLKQFLSKMSNVDDPVSLNSPLWPGCTLMHLAVMLLYLEANESYLEKLSYEFDLDSSIPESTFEVLEYLLDLQANPLAQDVRNYTPVHLTFRHCKPRALNYLLDHIGGPIRALEYDNATDLDGLSLLHISSAAGKPQVVKYLLRGNVDMDIRTKSGLSFFFKSRELYLGPGSTPLHYAVICDSTLIKFLIEIGADLLAVNSDGLTPLLLAFMGMSTVNFEKCEIEEVLSPPSELNFEPVSNKHLSHFHVACWSNSVSTVSSFLGRVDINEKIDSILINTLAECPRPLRVFIESLMLTDYVGCTPLHIAVKSKSLQVIKLLVESGADVHARDARGMSPLHIALANDSCNKSIMVLDSLMARDSEHKIKMPAHGPVDDYGVTALHIACRKLDVEWVQQLLDAGSDVNAQIAMNSPFRPGDTPLHVLPNGKLKQVIFTKFTHFAIAIANYLIAQGADLTIPNAKNVTPLHIVINLELPIVYSSNQFKNFYVNRVDREGFSFLHIATSIDNMEMVSELCTQGADIHRTVDYFALERGGWGPLHFAAMHGCAEMVFYLIEKGANVNAKDCRGCTPLHIFCENSSNCEENLIPKLQEYGADVNAQDVYGRTPLEILLENPFEHSRIISLISCGARLNILNLLSGNSLFSIGLSERKRYLPDMFKYADEADDLLSEMDDGSTAIHNIVRGHIKEAFVGAEYYSGVIEELLARGCYINARDNQGRTALHVAVEYDNYTGVCSLLAAGINANIADHAGNVPLSLRINDDMIHLTLLVYVHKLMLLGLEVCEPNRQLYQTAHEQGIPQRVTNHLQKELLNEIDALVGLKLHGNFSLSDIMKERAINEYPTMPRARRDAVVEKLASWKFCGTFPTLKSPVRYQYRRILERIDLNEPAKRALGFLMGNIGVPDLCIEKIISFLNNEDLKVIITVRKTTKRKAGTDECANKKVKTESP